MAAAGQRRSRRGARRPDDPMAQVRARIYSAVSARYAGTLTPESQRKELTDLLFEIVRPEAERRYAERPVVPPPDLTRLRGHLLAARAELDALIATIPEEPTP